jgi:hypothetical protein
MKKEITKGKERGKENVKMLIKNKGRERKKRGKIIHFLIKKKTWKKVEEGKSIRFLAV